MPTYRPKLCAGGCKREFTPTAGRQMVCDDCFLREFRGYGFDVVGVGRSGTFNHRAPIILCAACGDPFVVRPSSARSTGKAGRGYLCNPCKNIRQAADPAWRASKRVAGARMAADETWRENVSRANREKAQDPEWQSRNREGARRRWESPQFRANHAAAMRRLAEDPEWRRRQQEGSQKAFTHLYLVTGAAPGHEGLGPIVKVGGARSDDSLPLRLRSHERNGLHALLALWEVAEDEADHSVFTEKYCAQVLQGVFPRVPKAVLPDGYTESVFGEPSEVFAVAVRVISAELPLSMMTLLEPSVAAEG